jgi:pimeloyl-ACP methyl ester carboxylesterase
MVVLAASGAKPMRDRVTARSVVLISSANTLTGVTQRFADTFGLRPDVKALIDKRLEELGGQPIEAWSAVAGLQKAGVPALLIHDRSDSVVPFAEAEEIVRGAPGARLVATDRLGHNRVLYAEPVMRAVTEFLAEN